MAKQKKEKKDQLILITGATGKQGGAVARELLAHGHRVRAMTRKPGAPAAKALAALGAEVVKGDLDNADSVTRALAGAWGAFAVQNTWEAGVEREEEQGRRFAQIARNVGVQHLVYTSVQSANRKTGIPHFDNKWRIEEAVRAQRFPSYVILRPVFFMDNLATPPFRDGLAQGKLVLALAPATRLQMVAVEDIGKIGHLAFERHAEWNGNAIDLAGDSKTGPETAGTLSRVWKKKIEFVRQPIEQVRQFSQDMALMLEWFDRLGYNVDIPALERFTGYRMLRLEDWAKKVR